ncbi:hypothetical protein [Tenacibaculum singaporense]|uniref:hypothetical protein n=1 Tax=Tenacibaculum singaporense TaxID=2358479 RepID=UPI000F688EBE|nr:hypothetical protein [Tenacibaculum singaporense]RSC92934.1 hypothetical protein EI424_10840 [Tenacibaculum singaporense]
MRTTQKLLIFSILTLLSFNSIIAQDLNLTKVPKTEYLDKAKKIASTFFENLKNKNHKGNADFIVKSVGESWDESKKISQRNDYLAKFEIISLKPPKGIYGDLDGFDLIEQGFLKGSDRYFRHIYIGYHDGSVLIYEFRFYVDSKKNVTLHYIGWSEKNPFEYMSTPDILLSKYDK